MTPCNQGKTFLRARATASAISLCLLSQTAAWGADTPATTPASVVPHYKVSQKIAIGGDARWDLLTMDSKAQRLYVSHGNQTEVIDTGKNQLIATIPNTNGVHGIAIASELGLGFTSNGRDNTVGVFDLATLKVTKTIAVGSNPDVIFYDAISQRLISFNGKSKDATIIDPKTLNVVATVAIGGKPELADSDGNGKVWFNVEDSNELALLDPIAAKISLRVSIKPCDSPTGVATDAQHRVYSVCDNNLVVVTGPDGKPLGKAAIGAGPDGVVWQDGYAFSANGKDGTISVVGQNADGQWETFATIPTERGARTIAGDPATHKLYLPSAEFKPAQAGAKPQGIANTFHIIVLERQ